LPHPVHSYSYQNCWDRAAKYSPIDLRDSELHSKLELH